jgi:methyl-accepting chemotaxis protein
MSEISTASNEQIAGIEQVNLSINQMDENTQQNAALVEQAAAAAENLNEQAGRLTDTVGIFQLPGLTANTMVSNALQKAGKPQRNVPQVTSKPRVPAARRVGKAQAGEDEWESF